MKKHTNGPRHVKWRVLGFLSSSAHILISTLLLVSSSVVDPLTCRRGRVAGPGYAQAIVDYFVVVFWSWWWWLSLSLSSALVLGCVGLFLVVAGWVLAVEVVVE